MEFGEDLVAPLPGPAREHEQAQAFIAAPYAFHRGKGAVHCQLMQAPRLLHCRFLDALRDFFFHDLQVMHLAEKNLHPLQWPHEGARFGKFIAQRLDEVTQALDLDSRPVNVPYVVGARNYGDLLAHFGHRRIETVEERCPEGLQLRFTGVANALHGSVSRNPRIPV